METKKQRPAGVAKHKSQSVSNPRARAAKDERVRRTRARIDEAFVAILHRRPYGDIRISEICRKAKIGRATFYAHYADKDSLLRSQFERIIAPMLPVFPQSAHPIDATALFAHVRHSPQFFIAFMGTKGGTAPRVLRDCFEARIRQAWSSADNTALLFQQQAVPVFIASTLITLLERWLATGAKQSPGELQKLFETLTASAFAPGFRL